MTRTLAGMLWGLAFALCGLGLAGGVEHRFFPALAQGPWHGLLPLAGTMLGIAGFVAWEQSGGMPGRQGLTRMPGRGRRIAWRMLWAVLLGGGGLILGATAARHLPGPVWARAGLPFIGLSLALAMFLRFEPRNRLPGRIDGRGLPARLTLPGRVLIAAVWAAGFMAGGAVLALAGGIALSHSPHAGKALAGLGAEFGGNLFVIALCFAALPGARRSKNEAQPFGLLQGIWGMLGFAIVMAGGGVFAANVLAMWNIVLAALHSPARIDFDGRVFLLSCMLAGELAASLWVVWYVRRLGAARWADGGAAGIAWRAAPPQAYAVAALTACGIDAVVALTFHFMPPEVTALQALPEAKLFSGSGIGFMPVLFVIVFLGPFMEEIVFRGIAFGGIAARLGPLWAGGITTVVFMAAHAPEKLHYPPGFIDVGLVALTAAYFRVKFRSIRPGILLHILYNAGTLLAAAHSG